VIKLKRVYEPAEPDDGPRFLVDRLWPRGVARDALQPTAWLRDVAPSDELRKEFHHDPARWEELRRRYWAELDAKPDTWEPLLRAARSGTITLLFAARDTEHNNASALRDYLAARP
jgi:uncharacterized protein YeaO (DUF488 family)